jgi:hypothetical protein
MSDEASRKDETVILVCALADGPWCVRGSVFTFSCVHCNRRLMVAPLGQKIVRDAKGKALTLCERCARRIPGCSEITAPAAKDDIVPNLWDLRN